MPHRLFARLAGVAVFGGIAAACGPRSVPAPVTPAPAPAPAAAPAPPRGPMIGAPQLVPMPESLSVSGAAPFVLDSTTSIVTDGGADAGRSADWLAMLLRKSSGFRINVNRGAPAAGKSIRLRLGGRASLGDEGYELTATADSIVVVAQRGAGLFHGVQTLRQLFPAQVESDIGLGGPGIGAPALHIVDRPRFAWRGGMLDVARHFFTVDEVEQFIDLAAMYKLNIVHLHLTDDQGWRLQIDSRPQLTAAGSVSQVGGGPGGFYTKKDYADIIRYAADRYITIVPEIEMPSHINAALTAYPSIACSTRPTGTYTGTDVGWSALCVDSAAAMTFIDDVVREVAQMTPGPYLHIGGDEVSSLTRDQYVRFVEKAQDIVTKYGKTMVGWEEITKARLRPTSIAQQWKSDSATAAVTQGAKLIMSPADRIYLDMKYDSSTELGLDWAARIEVKQSYDWDPATYMKGVGESNIVGVEGPLWSETVRNITAAEYLIMPRLPAVAEIGWTPQAAKSWESFRTRVAAHAPRWNYLGVNFYRSPQIPW